MLLMGAYMVVVSYFVSKEDPLEGLDVLGIALIGFLCRLFTFLFPKMINWAPFLFSTLAMQIL